MPSSSFLPRQSHLQVFLVVKSEHSLGSWSEVKTYALPANRKGIILMAHFCIRSGEHHKLYYPWISSLLGFLLHLRHWFQRKWGKKNPNNGQGISSLPKYLKNKIFLLEFPRENFIYEFAFQTVEIRGTFVLTQHGSPIYLGLSLFLS